MDRTKRITIFTNKGTVYSYLVEDEDNQLTIGEWKYPFPNTKDESSAFGILECLAQSDKCPPVLREEDVVRIKIAAEQ